MIEREESLEVREINNFLVASYIFENQESHSYEDGFAIGDIINNGDKKLLPVLIADGATRVRETDNQYPSVSPQKHVADIAIQKALASINSQLKQLKNSNPVDFKEVLRQTVISANEAVNNYNRDSNLSGYNLAATTLTCVLIEENGKEVNLHWVSIGDSPIIVFSKGQVRIINPLQTANRDKLKEEIKKQLVNGENWSIWHREKLRNNRYSFNNVDIGYGVLTGEEKAEGFVVSGCESLKNSDFVVIATDGIIEAGLSAVENVLKDEKVSFEKKLPFVFGKVLTGLGSRENDDMTAVLIKRK